MPTVTLVETLKQVCLELDVSELDQLVSGVRKMKRVVAVVPALEKFYRQVCNYVLIHNPFAETADEAKQSTTRVGDRVLPVLQRWVEELGLLGDLKVRAVLRRWWWWWCVCVRVCAFAVRSLPSFVLVWGRKQEFYSGVQRELSHRAEVMKPGDTSGPLSTRGVSSHDMECAARSAMHAWGMS